ncbi:MAG: hypothetical protein EBR82_82395, partial [Caulobacteraceae bacterium]|nr:hypothetical protein [Caulobacteraceae bacterium]
RRWTHDANAVPASDLMDEAAAEIERLREAIRRLAEQDATLSLLCRRDGTYVVTVTMDATLTDAERYAIHWAADTLCVGWDDLKPDDRDRSRKAADTLRRLLERTK